MNKKRYIKPAFEVFELENPGDIICTSGDAIIYKDGVFTDESQIG